MCFNIHCNVPPNKKNQFILKKKNLISNSLHQAQRLYENSLRRQTVIWILFFLHFDFKMIKFVMYYPLQITIFLWVNWFHATAICPSWRNTITIHEIDWESLQFYKN